MNQEQLIVRAHFYFELSTKGIYHFMSLGSNLASEWSQIEEGSEIMQLIRHHFSKYFEGKICVATESIRVQEIEDAIELCLLTQVQIEVSGNELQPGLQEKLEDICGEICEAYYRSNSDGLEANHHYHDAHLLKMF